MKKNILITGAGGFIGKSLKEALEGQYTVLAMTHKELDLLNEDAIKAFFKNHKIDIILNCAISKNTIENLRMFFNMANCLSDDIYMIHMGSGAEYNKAMDLKKVSEKDFGKVIPKDDYGFSKYIMSSYIESKNNIICLRIFGLYGKYEDYRYKFISNAIVKNLLGMPIAISKNVVFDYLYINDFINIVKSFIEVRPDNKFINVTPSKSISLIEIVKIINDISDFQSEIKVLEEGLNKEYTANNLILLRNTENMVFTTYEEGIKDLFDYYKENLKELDIETIKNDPYLELCKAKNKNNLEMGKS